MAAIHPSCRIGVSLDDSSLHSRVVYVEPWGADYTLLPGERIEIVVIDCAASTWFNVVEHEMATCVWIEGTGIDLMALKFEVYQNGKRIQCGDNRGA